MNKLKEIPRKSSLYTSLAIGALIACAIFFRFYRLGMESLWTDEATTWWIVRMNWTNMFETLRNPGGQLPLFYIGAKAILEIFSGQANEWLLRSLSAASGLLTVLLAMRIGKIVSGTTGMIAAGWFSSFHPMLIWFARDGRAYSLSVAFAFLITILFLRLWEENTLLIWVLALSLLILGMLSHYFIFAFIGGLILISVTTIREQTGFFRRWVGITFIAFIPLALWLVWFMTQPDPHLGSGWIHKPDLIDLPMTLWNLVSGYGGAFSLPTTIFGGVGIFFIVWSVFSNKGDAANGKILVFGLFIPILAVWVLSQYQPLYVDRYLIIFIPFLTIPFASGVGDFWKKVSNFTPSKIELKTLPRLLFIVFYLLGIWNGWHTLTEGKYQRENWKALTADVNASELGTTTIWFSDQFAIIPFIYYYQGDFDHIRSETPPLCKAPCWWVLRQPFTYAHAFTQSINPENRPWVPAIPEECVLLEDHDYHTGILLWLVNCGAGT